MATHEQQRQRVVLACHRFTIRRGCHLFFDQGLGHDQFLAPTPCGIGAYLIGHPPRGHMDQPAPRII
jgi:hypothetical protein